MDQKPPPTTSLSTDLLVVLGGLATTAATLVAVFWLAARDSDFEIMSWYALFIIPAGAILVGIACGSGYGLASWWSGRKVSGGLLATVLILQLASYVTAQWLEFRSLGLVYDTGEPVGFFEYYDVVTRSMTLSFNHSRSSTGELGVLGYGFRLLELVGFAVGGLVIPFVLRAKPYCEACRRYMRSRSLGWIPAAVPVRKVNKKDAAAVAAYEQEMRGALESGLAVLERVVKAAVEGDASAVRASLDPLAAERKATLRLLHRIEVVLSECGRCHDGFVTGKLVSGQGRDVKTQVLVRESVGAGLTRTLA